MKKPFTTLLIIFCIATIFIFPINAETVEGAPSEGEATENQEVIYDLPDDGSVTIPSNDCFDGATTVKVLVHTEGYTFDLAAKAMESIVTKYVVYSLEATRDGVSVDPTGGVTVIFTIPSDLGNNVSLYRLSDNGELETVIVSIDDIERKVTADLKTSGTYILADEDSKPHVHEYTKKKTAPTCISEGYTTYTCSCGDKYVADTVPKSDHPFKSVVSLPTCQAEGYTAYTCTACKYSYVGDKVAKIDHVMGEWKQSKAPTYTEMGEEKRTCVSCTHFETRSIAVLEPPATTTAEVTTTVPVTAVTTTLASPTTESGAAVIPVTTVTDVPNGGENTVLSVRNIVIIALICAIVAVSVAIVVVLVTSKKKR